MKTLEEIYPGKKELNSTALPTASNFYKNCFLFVRSTENINAPGEIVTELFRETFYDSYSSNLKATGSRLDPNSIDLENIIESNPELKFTDGEKIVLEILRGKSKRDGKKKLYVYTPAYPQLMRNSWLRKKHGRNIRGHFIGGIVAQALHSKDHKTNIKAIEKFAFELFNACIGSNSTDSSYAELLFTIMNKSVIPTNDCFIAPEQVTNKLKSLILNNSSEEDDFGSHVYNLTEEYIEKDILPRRVLDDFSIVLKLEKHLPRIEWLNYFSNFLRIIIPIWVLSSIRSTIIIYDAIIDIVDNGKKPNKEEFIDLFVRRNREIFICSTSPNSGGENIIIEYAIKRVKLTLLLYLLEDIMPERLGKRLDIESCSKDCTSVFEFLEEVVTLKEKLIQTIDIKNELTLDTYLSRCSESYMAFRDPLRTSIFKNMSELLRVLREPESGFDSGGLLVPNKVGNRVNGYIVFPQPALIRLFTHLACQRKNYKSILIKDLIEHFESYGIDFSKSREARKKLFQSLMEIGLLEGSPDAEINASIKSPFK